MAAKKKAKGKPATSKKKKMGAVSERGEFGLMLIGGAFVGALAKRFGDTVLAKQTVVTDANTIKYIKYGMDGVEVLGGAFIAYKAKHPFVKGLGVGLAIEGSIHGLQTMGVLTGVPDINPATLKFPVQQNRVNGPNDNGKSQLGQGSPVNKRTPQSNLGGARTKVYGGAM